MPNHDASVQKSLQSVVDDLSATFGRITRVSHWYRTPAFPEGAGPDFVNLAVMLDTDMAPAEVLAVLHGIEARHGRRRDARWGARTVDLDLIAAGDAVVPDVATWRHWAGLSPDQQGVIAPDQLILPHPRMQDRSFVLVPMMDICPDWVHPVLGLSVAQMHANLSAEDRDSAVRLTDLACQ